MKSIAERQAKLLFDISGSSIMRQEHPYKLMIRTKHGDVHTIVFHGDLSMAQASRRRFITEFYQLRKAFVPESCERRRGQNALNFCQKMKSRFQFWRVNLSVMEKT